MTFFLETLPLDSPVGRNFQTIQDEWEATVVALPRLLSGASGKKIAYGTTPVLSAGAASYSGATVVATGLASVDVFWMGPGGQAGVGGAVPLYLSQSGGNVTINMRTLDGALSGQQFYWAAIGS